MAKFDYITRQLAELKNAELLRRCVCVDSSQSTTIQVDGRSKVLFCSNNYLGLANHPRVVEAVIDAVGRYGYGAGASRLISGTMRPHVQLEEKLANFLQKEAALVFPSGWTANEAVIRTLPQKGDIVLLDKLDHASIIDAAQSGPAEFRTYRRNNLDRLEKFLADEKYNRKFIITETVFSMDGDTADLRKLVELKKRFGAFLILDEAHAFGCLGETGTGLAEQMGLLGKMDIVVATMSKGLGATGGVVASERGVVDLLVNKARSFIYTTAPSPVNCAAVSAALDIIQAEPARREKLKANARYLRDRLSRLGLNTAQSCSHIIPVIVGGEKDTLSAARQLYEMGFFIIAIRPPTVAPGTARLRISVQSEHSQSQIDGLCDALEKLVKKGVLPTLNA